MIGRNFDMSLWFVLALMTAAAVFAVLWPLGRAPRLRAGGESAIYKDQLAEVERDRTAGLISAADAEAAQIEISRRLLASARSEHSAARGRSSQGSSRGRGVRACSACR